MESMLGKILKQQRQLELETATTALPTILSSTHNTTSETSINISEMDDLLPSSNDSSCFSSSSPLSTESSSPSSLEQSPTRMTKAFSLTSTSSIESTDSSTITSVSSIFNDTSPTHPLPRSRSSSLPSATLTPSSSLASTNSTSSLPSSPYSDSSLPSSGTLTPSSTVSTPDSSPPSSPPITLPPVPDFPNPADRSKLLNFAKLCLLYDVIEEMRRSQVMPYALKADPAIQALVHHLSRSALTRAQAEQQSLKIEPPSRKNRRKVHG